MLQENLRRYKGRNREEILQRVEQNDIPINGKITASGTEFLDYGIVDVKAT